MGGTGHACAVASWVELEELRPDLVEGGRQLLYQHGVGLAFLSTIRPDGGPRLHPFCPIISAAGLFGFIIPSPKQRDLQRDGRYAVHSFPTEDNEDAFLVSGKAQPVTDAAVRQALGEQFVRERTEIGVPFPGDRGSLSPAGGANLLSYSGGRRMSGRVPWPDRETLREPLFMYRALRWVIIVGLTALAVQSLPDLARYLKLRSL